MAFKTFGTLKPKRHGLPHLDLVINHKNEKTSIWEKTNKTFFPFSLVNCQIEVHLTTLVELIN